MIIKAIKSTYAERRHWKSHTDLSPSVGALFHDQRQLEAHWAI